MTESTAGERLRVARRAAGLSAEQLGRKAAQVLGRRKPISASAVRNQENGTNGIPVDTASAYATVLKISPTYLVWGEDAETAERIGVELADAADAGEGENWRDIQIPALQLISGNWITNMINPGKTENEQYVWAGVPGWSAADDLLSAYEVLDNTLEPVYRRGTHLIIADWEHSVAHHGSYVLAGHFQGTEIRHAIRQVQAVDDKVFLFTVGATKDENILLVDGDEVAQEYFIDGVVIASLHVERPSGPPLRIPEPDFMKVEDILGPDGKPRTLTQDWRKHYRQRFKDVERDRDEDFEGVALAKNPDPDDK